MTAAAPTLPKGYFDTLSSEEKAVLTNCGIPLDIKEILEMEDEKFNERINANHEELSEDEHNLWLKLSYEIKNGRKAIKDNRDELWSTLEEETKHNEWCGPNKGNGGNGKSGNGNGKAESKKDKEKPQIPIFKYSARFRKPLHEAILLNDEPVFLMWSEENERLITVTHIEENNRILRPPCIEEYPYEPVEFSSIEEIKEYAGLAQKETNHTLYYLNNLARQTLPFMYQTSIEGIRSIMKECWNIYESTDNKLIFQRLAALKLAKECHEAIFKLVDEGPSVMALKQLQEKFVQIQIESR